MQYDQLDGIGKCHKTPSPRHVLAYIKDRHPGIIEQAELEFIPLIYPLSHIDKIPGFVYDLFGSRLAPGDILTSRHVVFGVIALMYKKFPIGTVRKHYLHNGVNARTAKALNMQESNTSDEFNSIPVWFKSYPEFLAACERIRYLFLLEQRF